MISNRGDRVGVNPRIRRLVLNVDTKIASRWNVAYGSKRKKSGNEKENRKRGNAMTRKREEKVCYVRMSRRGRSGPEKGGDTGEWIECFL